MLASDTVAALHTVKPGPHTLALPTPRRVWDLLQRRRFDGQTQRIDLHVEPPATHIFYIGSDGEPWG